MFLRLAYKSLLNRKGSVALTLFAMTISVFVLIGVEHVRHQAKESFGNTVSGVDLIVGARTGQLNLLLYSVFKIGSPTNNMSWDSYRLLADNDRVKWAIPISLGDSHKGYRVMGTTEDYFEHFSYGNGQKLSFDEGKAFSNTFDVVLGAEVARKLGYVLGDKVVIAHGLASTSFSLHDDKPFSVVGILNPTGTPVDQTVHVRLDGIEAIHIDWQQGVRIPGKKTQITTDTDLTPESITAVMLGLNSKMSTFRIQRAINSYRKEALVAILPGVALSELWQMMAMIENLLRFISALVLGAALLGLSAMLLASIREREHEISLLRSIGASPGFLFALIELEALLITITAMGLAMLGLYTALTTFSGYMAAEYGLFVSSNIFYPGILTLVGIVVLCSIVACAIPSYVAYLNASLRRG